MADNNRYGKMVVRDAEVAARKKKKRKESQCMFYYGCTPSKEIKTR